VAEYDRHVAARYLKPGFVVARLVNPLLMSVRMIPTLAVRGRTSGEWRTVPVNVLDHDGKRYLVAPRGEAHWVRNLRAAGGGELRTRKGTETFRAVEVEDAEKPPLLEAYQTRWGGQTKSLFRELPDPADHPVFRIEPAT
jgi:deazaflavin-dependent oxidoreductase (nitroreductase family)